METAHFNAATYRLIPSRFPPVSVYEGLVANDRIDDLVKVENLTNPRLRSEPRLLEIFGDPNTPQLQNWNLAPFKYINPEGSRFFGPMRPALELADDPQTALAVAVRRRELFLSRTKEGPRDLDMRMFKTPVDGRFVDLQHLPPDMERSAKLEIGKTVPNDLDGVLFSPIERPTAKCVAVINKNALGKTIQTEHYRFRWDGERISSIYAFNNKGEEIVPEELSGPEKVLAA